MNPKTIIAACGALALAAGVTFATQTAERVGDPYTLETCPISGMKVTAKGNPVVKVYEGREVRFCCGGCVGRFESNLPASLEKLDAAIVKDQMPYAPTTTCIVSGEPLVEDGKSIAIDYVYNNRLMRLCCKGCIRGVRKDPAKQLEKLDAAIVKTQGKAYPLTTCVVSGEALDSMGKPVDVVVANRLIRLCCNGCKRGLMKDPAAAIAKVDAAWKKSGMPWRVAAGEAGAAAGAGGG